MTRAQNISCCIEHFFKNRFRDKTKILYYVLELFSDFFESYLFGHGGESSVEEGIIGVVGGGSDIKALVLVALYEVELLKK